MLLLNAWGFAEGFRLVAAPATGGHRVDQDETRRQETRRRREDGYDPALAKSRYHAVRKGF